MHTPMRAQRDLILDALQRGPATADELRNALRIPQPGTRVSELRKEGWPIVTIRLPNQRFSTYILADKAC